MSNHGEPGQLHDYPSISMSMTCRCVLRGAVVLWHNLFQWTVEMTGDVFEPGIEVSIILPKKGQLDVPHGQDSNNELAEKRRTISDTTKDPCTSLTIS